jgi:hypothetical protein
MQLARLMTIVVLAAVVLPHTASAQDVRPMARSEFDALLRASQQRRTLGRPG